MNKMILLLVCLLLPGTGLTEAYWNLSRLKDGYRISALDSTGRQRLIVTLDNGQVQLLLAPQAGGTVARDLARLRLYVDRGRPLVTSTNVVVRNNGSTQLHIKLGKKQAEALLESMRAGLRLTVIPATRSAGKRALTFSLLGFTAAWNDLLIANDIGSLDPRWLLENDRNNALFCLSAADFSVQATRMRSDGLSYNETLQRINRTGIPTIDDSILDVVEQVYSLPAEKLPLGARGDKYGIFRRCMEHLAD